MRVATFDTFEELISSAAEILLPPERIDVPTCADRHRYIGTGAIVGPWKNQTAPYLIEPMRELTSGYHTAVVFIGSAQSGKTEMILNWALYLALYDPKDMMIVQTTRDSASHFSTTRVGRMNRDCPDLDAILMKGKNENAIFTKNYRGGQRIDFGHPAASVLAGKPIPAMAGTDIDRMANSVDKEGSPFSMMQARTKSFLDSGEAMTLAETTCGFPILDTKWVKEYDHQGPPCLGLMSEYNNGDMRKYYYPCAKCNRAFEIHFKYLKWTKHDDNQKSAESVYMQCPHVGCGAKYLHNGAATGETDMPSKSIMIRNGFWLKEGQKWDHKNSKIIGEGLKKKTASFWLNGASAFNQTWEYMVLQWLNAKDRYERTGDETALQTTVNVDQGEPYAFVSMEGRLLPAELMARAKPLGNKVVPHWVRYLLASVDIQNNRFEVQVHGLGVNNEICVIDRFRIRQSDRIDEEATMQRGNTQYESILPMNHHEDWWLLVEQVLTKKYPLQDDPTRAMSIHATVCDSAGGDDTTVNAYAFYRKLRYGPTDSNKDLPEWNNWSPDLYKRFVLYKGSDKGPMVALSYPESHIKSKAQARREIPVLQVNTDMTKNLLNMILAREIEGSGMVHFPDWLEIWFYNELCAEHKNAKGKWVNPPNTRNETLDCFVMMLGLAYEPSFAGIGRIVDWDHPPYFALPQNQNMLVRPIDEKESLDSANKSGKSVSDLIKQIRD